MGMLVLTRSEGEKILIGDRIVVTVTRAGRGWARLGIDAPKSVLVIREELKDKPSGRASRREGGGA